MSRKTIPRETEKPKKLTRAQKKEIDAVIRKYKGDGKPRTAQATIPYEAIYPDGVCRIDRRTFSKCIAFEDISYQLAQPETRTAIFEHLCDLYNYVDASIHVQLSFLNRKVDPVQYAKSFEIAPQGDDFDDIRAEYTAILQKQLASGNNGIVKTKYLTFTIEADSLKTARARLTRIGLDLLGYFKTMGCVAHVMDGQERLEVLHGIFHPDGEPFRFDWDWLAPSGLSTKDFVAPSSLCFGTAKTFGLGGKYGAVSFLQILAPELSDEMLADFLKTESGILGVSRANPLVADFNADGRMDMIINGEPSDGSGFRNRIYYQNEEGKFTMDTSYPIVPVNKDGGINMGDWNGDGNMDIIVGGYIGTRDANAPACYSSPLRVYENKPEKNGLKGNTFPDAPGDVSAEMQGTELVIRWEDGSDNESPTSALRYNLFVRNETTEETYSLIPANRKTGKLKVGTDLQTSLSSRVKTYRIKPFGDGKYTVGVQTLDQSYAGSTFRTCTLEAVSYTHLTLPTIA